MTAKLRLLFQSTAVAAVLAFTAGSVMTGLPAPAHAQAATTAPTSEESTAFIKRVSEEVFAITRNSALSIDEQKQQLRAIMDRDIAIDYIAKISLGRYSNPGFAKTPEDKANYAAYLEEYYKLFPDYMFTWLYDVFISKFKNANVNVTTATPVGTTDVFVNTRITRPGEQDVSADWRIRRDKSGTLKVIDVTAEGISLAITQREEFAGILGQSGLKQLLEHMKSGKAPAVVTVDDNADKKAQ